MLVVDDDLGISGAGTQQRPGFSRLLAAVCNGEVGAVFALSNQTKSHQSSTGAARSGSALLAGLFRCARCGHKLNVSYRGRDGRAPRYLCMEGSRERGTATCVSFGGLRVEKAVVETVLEACQPLGVEASMQVLETSHEERDQKHKALEQALEKARYEAGRARRQYDAADPENRLVAKGQQLE